MTTFLFILMIFFTILCIGHYFLYVSTIHFFAVNNIRVKRVLMVIFSLGCVSFVCSTFLMHYRENSITQFLYLISGLWLAIGWHVIMAFICAWMITGINTYTQYALNYKKIMAALLLCAFIWSGYGTWSAFHPKIVHVTVKINNLPTAWKNKTAAQLSDVHLGNIYSAKFFTKVIARVNAERPDIVFITGDLFDGMDRALKHLIAPIDDVHAPDGIFFVTGNHETYVGVDAVRTAVKNTSIHMLDDTSVDVDGVQIIGVFYPERGEEKNIPQTIQNIQNFNAQKPGILLYHNPKEASSAESVGVDLQLAGHTHRGQLFPFQLITRFIYGASHYGVTQKDDFALYTSGGVGTWGPPMRTSGRPEIVIIHFE